MWLIEADVFQMPQLHKHFYVTGNCQEKKIQMKKGDNVKVKQGILDPDLNQFDMSGWQGRIKDITSDNESNLIEIAWDRLSQRIVCISSSASLAASASVSIASSNSFCSKYSLKKPKG